MGLACDTRDCKGDKGSEHPRAVAAAWKGSETGGGQETTGVAVRGLGVKEPLHCREEG